MAVPTIGTVAPATVWTHGQLITITGTNFRLAPIPSQSLAAPYPAPIPAVKVTVDGVVATGVKVRSATEVTCFAPAHDPGAVPVTVQNVDDAGVPIAGEIATLANAFTYARPALTDEPDFARLTRQVVRDLKRAVLENVVMFRHSDYDGTEFEQVDPAKLPSLGMSGPHITWDSPAYRKQGNVVTGAFPDVTHFRRRRSLTVDLQYDIIGLAVNTTQLLALETAVLLFLERHTHIEIDKDAADPAKGKARYPLFVPRGTFRNTTIPSPSNIRSFAGSFVIRGVNIEELASFPGEALVDKGGTQETLTILAVKL